MDVRLARPTDAPLVLTLSVDDEAHLVRPWVGPSRERTLRTIARAGVPVVLPGRMWICRDDQGAGLIEAVPRRYVIGWDVTRLAIRGDRAALLGPLVAAAADHLRTRGVPRLFARCTDDAVPELKTVAFHSLAREIVLIGAGGEGDAVELPEDARYRMPQDAWPLHQLESDVTPALVRQMEGLTSMEWTQRVRGMEEIVVERDGKTVCWIGWGVKLSHNRQQLGLLVHPDHRELAPLLLGHVLSRSPGTPFVVRVRDYQGHVLDACLRAGFEVVAEETLMVKHARLEPATTMKRVLPQVAAVPPVRLIHHCAFQRCSAPPAFARSRRAAL